MRKSYITFCFLLLILIQFSFGCASGTSSRDSSTTLNRSIGTATLRDLRESFQKIVLSKYHYEYEEQRETTTSIYYETRWQSRDPFPDEEQRGVEAVRTRVKIDARPRTRSGLEQSELYSVRFTGEQVVLIMGAEQWVNIRLSEEARAYFQTISRDMEVELQSGFRRF